MRYKISKKAAIDLKEIWRYTLESWSIEQADYYYNLIFDEIEHLARNPESGKDYGHLRKGYFRSTVKSHLIFYKFNSQTKILEVIRILHQKMDIESRLED